MRKVIIILFFSLIITFSFFNITFARIPYNSYTYNPWNDPMLSPHVYLPDKQFSGDELGIGNFKTPQDIFIDDQNQIYILDSGNRRIVILDEKLELMGVISKLSYRSKKNLFINLRVYLSGRKR